MPDTTTRRARTLILPVTLSGLFGCQADDSVRHDEPQAQIAAQEAPLGPPPPDHPSWNPRTNVGIGGNGCPAGVASLLAYRDGFDLVFPNNKLVSSGNQVVDRECVVTVQLPDTPGWQYALRRARVVGRQTLPRGARRGVFVDMSLGGGLRENIVTSDGSSALDTRFGMTYDATPRWSECGPPPTGSARPSYWISVSVDHTLSSSQEAASQLDRLMVDFTWRRCSP